MPDVDCPMTTCKHNVMRDCNMAAIALKWRFAADMGKGNIVCLECLNLDLGEEAKDGSKSDDSNPDGGQGG